MGLVFGVIFGSVGDNEVGSASGTLSAVQQLGGALGVAGITTIYFGLARDAHGTAAVMTTALAAAGTTLVTFGLVFLLPKQTRTRG